MEILVASLPAYGHLDPLMPLALVCAASNCRVPTANLGRAQSQSTI
jgi:hypothetical protein